MLNTYFQGCLKGCPGVPHWGGVEVKGPIHSVRRLLSPVTQESSEDWWGKGNKDPEETQRLAPSRHFREVAVCLCPTALKMRGAGAAGTPAIEAVRARGCWPDCCNATPRTWAQASEHRRPGPRKAVTGPWTLQVGAQGRGPGDGEGAATYCRAARWWPTAQTSSRSAPAPRSWSSRPPAAD